MKVILLACLLAIAVLVSGVRVKSRLSSFSEGGAHTLFTLKISGNYCGPGYCGGRKGDYTKNACNFNAPAKDCGDRCCRAHDDCCIRNRNSCGTCDSAISKCLKACSGGWTLNPTKLEWKAMAIFFDHRPGCC